MVTLKEGTTEQQQLVVLDKIKRLQTIAKVNSDLRTGDCILDDSFDEILNIDEIIEDYRLAPFEKEHYIADICKRFEDSIIEVVRFQEICLSTYEEMVKAAYDVRVAMALCGYGKAFKESE